MLELIIDTKQVAEKGSYQCWLTIIYFPYSKFLITFVV